MADGKIGDSNWFDTTRLEPTGDPRVMDHPWLAGSGAPAPVKGPAEKPKTSNLPGV